MHDPVLFGVEGIPDPLDAAHDALWSALRHIDAFGEKSRARARHKDAMRRAIKAINSSEPNPDIRDEIISHYQKLRRPQWPKRGRPENANTLRDQCIADIVEEIRRRGFDVHRSRATKDKESRASASSIVAAAWRKLEDGEAPATRLKQGFAPFPAGATKALSEESIERIWDESEWAAKLQTQKRRTPRR